MRYFRPVLAPGDSFQSKRRSKSPYSLSVTRSSLNFFPLTTVFSVPFSIVHALFGTFFLAGSFQPANDFPSNISLYPCCFSSGVRVLSFANAAKQASVETRAAASLIFFLLTVTRAGQPGQNLVH